MTANSKAELIQLARDIAVLTGLDPVLFCCVIEQESSWNPEARRYEPGFHKKYIDPIISRFSRTSPSVFRKRVLPGSGCRPGYPAPSNCDRHLRRPRFHTGHPSFQERN
jgi:hypothetical protein